jgi:hypothetical protein
MRVLSIQKSAFPFSTPWPFTSPEVPNPQDLKTIDLTPVSIHSDQD